MDTINRNDIHTVTQLNNRVNAYLEKHFNNISVEGIDEFQNVQVSDWTGTTLIDDYYFDGQWPNISVGNTYTSIVGVVGYSYSEF